MYLSIVVLLNVQGYMFTLQLMPVSFLQQEHTYVYLAFLFVASKFTL